jgi:hypothetical protein
VVRTIFDYDLAAFYGGLYGSEDDWALAGRPYRSGLLISPCLRRDDV